MATPYTETREAREHDMPRADGRPLSGLFSDLWRETTALVQDEIELARADMTEKVSQAATGAQTLLIGGAVLFAGLIVLLFAAVGGLALAFPPDIAQWLSPLIVGGVVAVIGGIAVASGRSKMKARNLKPERTIESLRRDRHMAKEHLQ
jgi:hypothetical protein